MSNENKSEQHGHGGFREGSGAIPKRLPDFFDVEYEEATPHTVSIEDLTITRCKECGTVGWSDYTLTLTDLNGLVFRRIFCKASTPLRHYHRCQFDTSPKRQKRGKRAIEVIEVTE